MCDSSKVEVYHFSKFTQLLLVCKPIYLFLNCSCCAAVSVSFSKAVAGYMTVALPAGGIPKAALTNMFGLRYFSLKNGGDFI